MITFADAKRVVGSVRAKHGTESKFFDLFMELLVMLEETTAKQIVDYEQRLAAANKEREKALVYAASVDKTVELEELNRAYHKLGADYDKLKAKYEQLTKPPEEENGGRKKKPTKETEIHDLAVELANMEG